MALEDLQVIGLAPETLFLSTVLARPINFAPEERTALASNLSETEYTQNWMQQNGYSEAYAEDPFFATYVVLQTGDGRQGLLADIVADRDTSGRAYQIFQDAALFGTNDVVGQLASGYFNGFSDVIETMLTQIGEGYPNWTESQLHAFVRVLILNEAVTTQYGADNFIEAITGRASEIHGSECFLAGTMITMADGSKKPIEQIRPDDWVLSMDQKTGQMVPGKVTRTFQNEAKIILDFHGTFVTPGHVYYRPDSKRASKFEPLIDILRDDGIIQYQDGTLIRAATNVPVDSPRDGFVQAVTQMRKADGTVVQHDTSRIRLGTRFLVGTGKERKSFAVADLIKAGGGVVGDDELIRIGDGPGMPFHWEFGDTLPKPEDFVLACSGTTLEDIYKAAEWESQGPRLPAPMVLDRGPVQPLTGVALQTMPRNQPLSVAHSTSDTRTANGHTAARKE